MSERVWCLDTTVWIKYLTPDEQEEAATRLVVTALTEDVQLVAPPWAWAELGSILRKKVRSGLLTLEEAEFLFFQRVLQISGSSGSVARTSTDSHGASHPGRAAIFGHHP